MQQVWRPKEDGVPCSITPPISLDAGVPTEPGAHHVFARLVVSGHPGLLGSP